MYTIGFHKFHEHLNNRKVHRDIYAGRQTSSTKVVQLFVLPKSFRAEVSLEMTGSDQISELPRKLQV